PIPETAQVLPSSAYGLSKALCEIVILSTAGSVRAATVLRLANLVGPGERRRSLVSSVARQIAEIEAGVGYSVRHGRLDEARDFIDVRDVARAFQMCCEVLPAGARIYNVASGIAL